MHVEGDDDADLMSVLAAEGVNRLLTRRTAREANYIYEMLLVHGVSRGAAAAKVAELYSPPPGSLPSWDASRICHWLTGRPLT